MTQTPQSNEKTLTFDDLNQEGLGESNTENNSGTLGKSGDIQHDKNKRDKERRDKLLKAYEKVYFSDSFPPLMWMQLSWLRSRFCLGMDHDQVRQENPERYSGSANCSSKWGAEKVGKRPGVLKLIVVIILVGLLGYILWPFASGAFGNGWNFISGLFGGSGAVGEIPVVKTETIQFEQSWTVVDDDNAGEAAVTINYVDSTERLCDRKFFLPEVNVKRFTDKGRKEKNLAFLYFGDDGEIDSIEFHANAWWQMDKMHLP